MERRGVKTYLKCIKNRLRHLGSFYVPPKGLSSRLLWWIADILVNILEGYRWLKHTKIFIDDGTFVGYFIWGYAPNKYYGKVNFGDILVDTSTLVD